MNVKVGQAIFVVAEPSLRSSVGAATIPQFHFTIHTNKLDEFLFDFASGIEDIPGRQEPATVPWMPSCFLDETSVFEIASNHSILFLETAIENLYTSISKTSNECLVGAGIRANGSNRALCISIQVLDFDLSVENNQDIKQLTRP